MYKDRQDRQYRQEHNNINGFDEICIDNNDDNNDSMEHIGDENIVEINILRPGFECYLKSYKLSGELYQPGVYYHTFSKGVPVDIRISSPLIIKYATCDHNNNNQGRVISLIDPQGNQHELTMPMHVLKGSGEELLGELLSRGLLYHRRHKNLLLDYIMNSVPKKTILAVSKTGWYASNIFILHNKVIGAKDVIFQSDHIVESHFSVSGSVESWINAIGTKCVDNIPLMISVAMALAGPVFGKLNILSTGGIHWYGDSSLGKTTAALVAASIYGDHKFINSWNSTKNGIEGLALCRNDTLIILDEIDEANAQDVGANVYQIFNGQGKQRANKFGNARDVNKWRAPVISTGERSLINVMNEAKIPPNAGHLIRMLNVEANFNFGIFNNLHEFTSGKDLSNFLKEQTQFNYGAIGPAFIEHLIKEQDITPRFTEINNMLECLGENNLEQRVLSFLSVVAIAGELGIKYGLLPWEQECMVDAVAEIFIRWKKSNISNKTEDERIVSMVRTYIEKYEDSRFSAKNDDITRVQHRSGWYEDQYDKRTYMLTSSCLTDAAPRFDADRIARALKDQGCIAAHDDKRRAKNTYIKGKYMYLYHVDISGIDK